MSRIGKKPVSIPAGVQISLKDSNLAVKGPKGELKRVLPEGVKVAVDKSSVTITRESDEGPIRARHGLVRALINNMVEGVTKGFERKLEINGVGYKADVAGEKLNLSLGFSHPVVFQVPAGITLATPTQTEILVSGADKQQVGEVAAKIRAYRKPEPYKGKGIRYAGEKIIMKEAKKA